MLDIFINSAQKKPIVRLSINVTVKRLNSFKLLLPSHHLLD